MFVRYCEPGEIRRRFEPVDKGNADNITDAIKQVCQTNVEFAEDDFI